MKNFKKSQLLLLTMLGILIYSCQNDDAITPQIEEQTYLNQENQEGLIKLGKKLENPYAIENMSKALENLKKSGTSTKSSTDEIKIITTHLYVKFKPKNEEELDILKRDSTLVLYNYPLDYEIEEGGYFYRDPEVSENQPTYQYCAVKADKELPDEIEYETLAELFIPDEDKDTNDVTKTGSKTVTYKMVDALVDEALRITNNLGNLQNKSLKTTLSKWRPTGTIKVWDDVVRNFIGVEGVIVRARRWFTTHRGIANATGYYSCDGRFRRDANYSIDWERYDFALQDGWLNGATYNGPKKRGNWDLNLDSGEQEYYATIFRGAYLYYYGNMFGLTRPPGNSFFKRQLKIKARLESGKSSYVKARRIWFGSDISLQAWGKKTDEVFGTTIHELAHAAHREVDRSAYNSLVWKGYTSPCAPSAESCDHPGPTGANARRLMETWASTVEHFMVKQRYKNHFKVSNYTYYRVFLQRQTISQSNFYTSAGIDMMDDNNQRITYKSNAYPVDRVKGYTINQLENSLKGATTWNTWRNNLKNNYSNLTEQYLDELFVNWTN